MFSMKATVKSLKDCTVNYHFKKANKVVVGFKSYSLEVNVTFKYFSYCVYACITLGI